MSAPMPNDEIRKLRRGWLCLVAAVLFLVTAGLQWFLNGAALRASAFTLAGILFIVAGIRHLRWARKK